MKILDRFDAATLLSAVRSTRLRGFDQAEVYATATLGLETLDPDDLTPAQNFVLRPTVDTIHRLRAELATDGVELFALDGGLWIEEEGERIPVIPPIVEESHEPDGRVVLLVNDGMHRVFAAREAGSTIRCVVARNVPPEYPYYAYALDGGWAQVTVLDELVEGFQKKDYRIPESYKSLFRDFNAPFPGVQAQRKQTNPEHLRPW